MARVEHYFTRFEEGTFYHVYNRTVDKKPLFINEGNNDFFLQKFNHYLSDVIEVYAYCLLQNHFHFLIRIPDNLDHFRAINHLSTVISTHEIVSKQFRIFFQSYALSFNKQQNRCGTLFQTPFKRARVKDNRYLINLIFYIHTNSQKHELVSDFRKWKWSSYHQIMLGNNTEIQKQIISWFGNKDDYINFHNFDNL